MVKFNYKYIIYCIVYIASLTTTMGMIKSSMYKITNKCTKFSISSTSETLESIKKVSVLKVPSTAWKWPGVWPFPKDYLDKLDSYETDIIDSELQPYFVKHTKDFISESNSTLVIGILSNKDTELQDFKHAFYFPIDDVNKDVEIPFPASSFDSVILRSGIEHFTDPIDVYKEIWRVLKPTGRCFTCFSGKPQLPNTLLPVKMWTTMTDEQKIWIAGSYYHYSAIGGWQNIEAYDVLGITGEKSLEFNTTDKSSSSAFIVQSNKIEIARLDESEEQLSDNLLIRAIAQRLLGVKYLQPDDIKFLSYRLASSYNQSTITSEQRKVVLENINKLSSIYKIIKEIKEIVIPSPVKAMLSVLMLNEWENLPSQCISLRMALSLESPDYIFWIPVSKATSQMPPKDKIYFLADIVPKFGIEKYAQVLQRFPTILTDVLEVLISRFPQIPVAKLQTYAVDLVYSELFSPQTIQKDSLDEKILRFVKQISAEDVVQ